MKLYELKEEVIWENDDLILSLVENTTTLQLALKGKAGSIIKDTGKLAQKSIQQAGIIGSYALDHLKRYKEFKASAINRTISFFARDTFEKQSYEKMINVLTKNGHFKIVRTFPYSGGGRLWELQAGKKSK